VHARHHTPPVDAHGRLEPELGAAAREAGDLGGPDQGLRRDAPDVDSGAAKRGGLDQEHSRAEAHCAHRRADPTHAATHDDQVGREAVIRPHLGTMPQVSALLTRIDALLPRGWRDFWLQAAVFWAFYVCYEGSRGVSDGARDEAFRNADRVIDAERSLGIFRELDLQRWALDAPDLVMTTANWTYFNCQFTISYGFMLWAYFRRNHAWYFMRNVLIVAGFLGLIGYIAYPTAPPRMFPELGFEDTLNQTAVNHESGIIETFANPYAAMPSLHTAYALIIGTSGFLVARHLVTRLIWAAYPALVVFSIVTTANHWFLDAIAGAFVALFAALAGLALTRGVLPRRGREPAGPLVRERRRTLRTPPGTAVPAGAD
jgi:membrane-associated phospholipid phosphatase